MEPLLVILDIDETLISGFEGQHPAGPQDFDFGRYQLVVRPGLADFFAELSSFAQVAVWSSADKGYVEGVLPHIRPATLDLRFVWSGEQCTRRYDQEYREDYYIKNLSRVKSHPLSRMLMVDDTPQKLERNYSNLVRIPVFKGNRDDRALGLLARYLRTFVEVPDVRLVEKRGWYNREW